METCGLKDDGESGGGNTKTLEKDRFPRIVILIVIAEFCERFSFSAMKAFLTLYMRSKLGFSDDNATELYHLFCVLSYLFPIIGGIVADNYLGKYRTILYMLFVYASGNVLVAVTAVPGLGLPARLCTMLALLMITIGTGGIKPCVTAFGGDQFDLPRQERHLAIFFSVLYFTINVGALIAKTISPILRSDVQCFGDKDCYSLAFAAPGFVVVISIIIFASARSRYVMKQSEGNIVFDFIKCVYLGIKTALSKKGKSPRHHWLDATESNYDPKFVKDVKRAMSVIAMFVTIPIFWALLDQMGSRWTLQATKTDGHVGFLNIKPDQLQVLDPIFILFLIPLSQKYIYPYLAKRNILKNPLHKMALGGILAGVAFICSGTVEIYLKKTLPEMPQEGYSQLRIFNGNPCAVSVHSDLHNITHTIQPLDHYTNKHIRACGTSNVTLSVSGTCIRAGEKMFVLDEKMAVSFFLDGNVIHRFEDYVGKSRTGLPTVRILTHNSLTKSNITLFSERSNDVELWIDSEVAPAQEVFATTYSVNYNNQSISDMKLRSGGVYTVVIGMTENGVAANTITLTAPNSLSMLILLPQFFIISVSEVLMAVTGIEFAFTESPESMKTVMSSMWLFTVAIGNMIVIIVTRVFASYRQETQSFIYASAMFVSVCVFYLQSRHYRSVAATAAAAAAPRRLSEMKYLQLMQTDDCLQH